MFTKTKLSRGEKISIGVLSATIGLAAFGVIYTRFHARKKKQYITHDIYIDNEDEDTPHIQNKSSGNRSTQDLNASSHSMQEKTHLNVFNSSRLNVFNSSRLNEDTSAQDSMSHLHDLSAAKLLPDDVKFLSNRKLIDLIKTNKNKSTDAEKYVLFDLRAIDFNGGYIKNSINLPDNKFYDEIPNIFTKYNSISSLIVQCMDGSLRSIEAIEYYSKARKQLIKYYNKDTKLSYYYKYKLKIQHGAHKTVMRSIKWDNEQWMKKFVEKKKIIFDFNGKEEMYENLMKQKLFVVAGGFFDFLNLSMNDKLINLNDNNIIVDFDNKYWEELTVMGEKKLYHKIEYYTTRRSNPLRKTTTKRCF